MNEPKSAPVLWYFTFIKLLITFAYVSSSTYVLVKSPSTSVISSQNGASRGLINMHYIREPLWFHTYGEMCKDFALYLFFAQLHGLSILYLEFEGHYFHLAAKLQILFKHSRQTYCSVVPHSTSYLNTS